VNDSPHEVFVGMFEEEFAPVCVSVCVREREQDRESVCECGLR